MHGVLVRFGIEETFLTCLWSRNQEPPLPFSKFFLSIDGILFILKEEGFEKFTIYNSKEIQRMSSYLRLQEFKGVSRHPFFF